LPSSSIDKRMFVATNTMRTHLHNINVKFDVRILD
jgi:ATP/maltotriose-dependent transcriptional regulator MalT